MPALITEIIPQQGFEKVRDAIGVIILTELVNQKTLQGSAFPEKVNVYSERITPIDNEELVYINILLDSATYGEFNQRDTQGRTLYFIDIYTNGQGSSERKGSSDSSIRLHKFIGMIRYILSSTLYMTLGLPNGLIGGKYLESFATLDPAQKEDSEFTRFARLQFAVRIQENQALWSGVDMLGNDTTVKLELTEKGYKYVLAA